MTCRSPDWPSALVAGGPGFRGVTLALPRAKADPAAVTPVRQLCDTLLAIMKAGRAAPFQSATNPGRGRGSQFDLAAILPGRTYIKATGARVS